MILKKNDFKPTTLINIILIPTLCVLALNIASPVLAQDTLGKALFASHCQTCHGLHSEVIGPALNQVMARRSLPWLLSFIRSSQKLIASGDTAAINIHQKYLKVDMPDQPLPDTQILEILQYIQNNSQVPMPVQTARDSLLDFFNENFMTESPGLTRWPLFLCLGIFFLALVWWVWLRTSK